MMGQKPCRTTQGKQQRHPLHSATDRRAQIENASRKQGEFAWPLAAAYQRNQTKAILRTASPILNASCPPQNTNDSPITRKSQNAHHQKRREMKTHMLQSTSQHVCLGVLQTNKNSAHVGKCSTWWLLCRRQPLLRAPQPWTPIDETQHTTV
jgi:hypothetical protein